jgi:hypothetical protein
VAIIGIEKLLLRTQLRNVILQKLLVLILGLVNRLYGRRPFFEVDLASLLYAEFL